MSETKNASKAGDDDEVFSLDEVDDNAVVKLRSKEGEVFEVNRRAAMISRLIKSAIENGRCCCLVSVIDVESALVFAARQPFVVQ